MAKICRTDIAKRFNTKFVLLDAIIKSQTSFYWDHFALNFILLALPLEEHQQAEIFLRASDRTPAISQLALPNLFFLLWLFLPAV